MPLPEPGRPLPYGRLYAVGAASSEPLCLESLSLFFRYALSLTAWKRFQDKTWSLRANPSSGNLHPTEGYAVLPAIEGVGAAPAVYHYAPEEHATRTAGEPGREGVERPLRTVPRWFLPCGPFVGPLAGSLEVRRARVPLLPARCGACTCHVAHCGRGAWLGTGAPRWGQHTPSRTCSGSAAMTTTGRRSVRSPSFSRGSDPIRVDVWQD